MFRSLPKLVFSAALLGGGCASHADQLMQIRASFNTGNTEEAKARIDKAIESHSKEADVLKLDRAMVLLTEGKPKEAEALLREVRDRFDALEGKDLAEGALAMLTDDQQLSYAGEDYEKVLIRLMLSISNLLGDGSDAGAYALQVNQKQQQIIENSKAKTADGKNLKETYKYVPAGAYLNAILREETHVNYDDAARSFEQVAQWQPDFAPVKQDLERVKTGHHSAEGNGVVYVFAMVGKGPRKEERMEIVSTAALLIADRIVSAMGKQSLPPTIAPIKVPVVVAKEGGFTQVSVSADGKQVGQAQTIADIGRMASEQSAATLPDTLARAVVRRVVKKGVVFGVKEAINTNQNQIASLALNAAGVVWEATESADTRCWGLLPDKIQVLRIELPAGEHEILLGSTNQTGGFHTSGSGSVRVRVDSGRNTYLLANIPSAQVVGKISTNKPAK